MATVLSFPTGDPNRASRPAAPLGPARRTRTVHGRRSLRQGLLVLAGAGLVPLAPCAVAPLRRGRGRRRARRTGAAAAAALPSPRPGHLAPGEPSLLDPALNGRGLYSHADFLSFFKTATTYGWADCEMEGVLPPDLEGTLYHNGPGRVVRGETVYRHFLDGDGFVNAWRLEGGKVRYRGDFVRTPEYQAEEKAQCVLYRGAFGTSRPGGWVANAFDLRSKNLANTNIVAWGGRLLALYEAAHPSRLNPDTLAYTGDEDFGGLLKPGISASSGYAAIDQLLGLGGDAFTAHPKLDAAKGLLVGFSWTSRGGGIELKVHEWDAGFVPLPAETARSSVFLPGSDSSPHDFGLTSRRCVFLENRFKLGDLPGYILGRKGPAESLVGQPELPQRVHVLPRRGHDGDEVRSIDGHAGVFDVHVAHCHDGPPIGWRRAGAASTEDEERDLVTAYTSSWDEFPAGSLFGEWGEEGDDYAFPLPLDVPRANMNKTPRARLVRHIIDARRGEVVERCVVPGDAEALAMEHPTINCAYTGDARCRYIYMVIGNEAGLSTPPSGWARVDLLTGCAQRWYAGSRCFADEPHFVARQGPRGTWSPGGPTAGVAEDDGWVLAMLYDAAKDCSCLCVFDAAKLEDGPICRAWVPHGIPHSLHGCFVPKGAQLDA